MRQGWEVVCEGWGGGVQKSENLRGWEQEGLNVRAGQRAECWGTFPLGPERGSEQVAVTSTVSATARWPKSGSTLPSVQGRAL